MIVLQKYFKASDFASENLVWIPLLIARLAVGFVYAQAGWGKLQDLNGIVEFFTSIHIPHPELMAPFVGTIEFAGGSLLILGLFTRFAAIPLIGTMIVAIITVKSADFKDWTDLFGDSDFVLALILFILVFVGAGSASLDALLEKRFRKVEPAI